MSDCTDVHVTDGTLIVRLEIKAWDRPPKFKGSLSTQTAMETIPRTFTLPQILDPNDDNTVTATASLETGGLPSFITFEENAFNFDTIIGDAG